MSLRVFVTGGTFDKEYDELTGQLHFKDTHLPEMLRRGRSMLDISIEVLMMIDSLEMLHEHRLEIIAACKRAQESQILITHGTDTMTETATVLAEARLNKTIVLTGAMVPYAFGSSDGLFNLGSALSFAQTLPSGVYIAMNGRYFPAGQVTKNRAVGVFEEVSS